VPDITNPFFPAVVQAVEGTLRNAGFSLLLCDAGNDVAAEAELLGNLLAHQADGLLISVCDRIASRHAVRLATSRLPVVQIDRRALGGMPYVGVDQADAIAQLAGHLREQGYRRFAYITPHTGISTAQERLDEFIRQVQPLDPGVGKRIYTGDFSMEWGYEAARRIIAQSTLPDVIACANDLIAVGAVQALREQHIDIPREVAVTGFDDTVLAVATQPQLTTIRQPLGDLGREAVSMLCAAIAQPGEPPRSAVLKGKLIVRGSSRRHDQDS
jgi:LacI family transcriptional regulator